MTATPVDALELVGLERRFGAVVALDDVSFRVPVGPTPQAAPYLEAVLAHPPVRRWMDAARALPPRETY